MQSTVNVSVLICTYNRSDSLRETLATLGSQSVSTSIRWEILIVDNNSTDTTKEIVLEFAAKSPVPVSYLFEKRQGLSFARNTGLAHCSGEVLAFTDDDITPERDWVQSTYELLCEYHADGIGGRVLAKWPGPPPVWIKEDLGFLTLLSLLDSDEFGRIQSGNGVRIIGANMAFRRALFDQVGLFDTKLGRIGKKLYSHDETDFVMRAVQLRKLIVYDPKLVVWQRLEQSRMERAYFRSYKFDNGENRALRLEKVNGRTAFGVPLSALRTTYGDAIRWLKAVINNDPQRFRKELNVWYGIGFIWGRLKTRRSSAAVNATFQRSGLI